MEALESVVVLDSRWWAELPSRSASLHPFGVLPELYTWELRLSEAARDKK